MSRATVCRGNEPILAGQSVTVWKHSASALCVVERYSGLTKLVERDRLEVVGETYV